MAGQVSEIPLAPNQGAGVFPMFDHCPVEPKEVSRQLWAFLGQLVASESSKTSTFKNVARHNGLSPADIHHYDEALRDWSTNLRLFKEAGGQRPTDKRRRGAGVHEVFLPDVRAHVMSYMHLPQCTEVEELRRFTDKYVKA